MTSMEGKTVIITGATSGIGEQTLMTLAKQGARVGFIGRSEEKCRESRDRARLHSGNPFVRYHLADLTELQQVEEVAQQILDEYERIDVLINNAGLICHKHQRTADGLETMFGVNHLAHFLLTHRLFRPLEQSPEARIINVASAAFMMANIDYSDLQWQTRKFRSMQAYADSKHANILFTLGLAQHLMAPTIRAFSLHPGIVASGFAGGFGPVARTLAPAMAPFIRSSGQGAQTSIHLASAALEKDRSGGYYANRRRAWLPAGKRKPGDVERLWTHSEALLAKLGHPV